MLCAALFLILLPVGSIASPIERPVIEVGPGEDLQAAIDAASEGAILQLAAGTYTATPLPYDEPTCGNCQDLNTPVKATTGFVIRDKSLTVRGAGRDETVLVTNAGYGVYIEGRAWVSISGLQVTGGVRDADGQATDGAVVAKDAVVHIEDCLLGPNPTPKELLDQVVVGICGAVGREGALLSVWNTEIRGNSWDGVALYRGAQADLYGLTISEGRGAGIGITWDADADVTTCIVTEYWKGIGTFGTSVAKLRNCLVHHCRGWGIIASGESTMDARNCTVAYNGNVGIAKWNPEAHMTLKNSISAFNGTVDQWVAPRVGLWWNDDGKSAPSVSHCLFYGNTDGNFLFGYEGTEDKSWTLEGQDGIIVADPLFVSDTDLHLQSGSPATDAGDPVSKDLDGSPADLGAYGGKWRMW